MHAGLQVSTCGSYNVCYLVFTQTRRWTASDQLFY